MTTYRTTHEVEVQPDGMLHLSVPDARPGERVRVVVEREDDDVAIEEVDGKPVRVFGQFKDRIRILPGFYDPVVFPEG